MRCPDCNKFVSLEMQDPEVNDLEIQFDNKDEKAKVYEFSVSGSVRIVRACGECGQELKEATLDISEQVSIPFSKIEDIEDFNPEDVEVEEGSVDTIEEGGGRYAKSFFGASLDFDITHPDAKEPLDSGSWSDKVAASSMDEMV